MPVRRGYPTGVGGLTDVVNSPMYATGVGLVIYGSKNLSKDALLKRSEINIISKTIHNIKKWFLEFF
jgi:cell division protein FtsA